MTIPTDVLFADDANAVAPVNEIGLGDIEGARAAPPLAEPEGPKLPPPIIDISPEAMTNVLMFLDEEIEELEQEQSEKLKQWASYEEAYRARTEPYKTEPFEGACSDVIPVIAMAVDPVVARLYTGIWKQDPVFKVKALKKSFVDIQESLSHWLEYYQRNKLKFARVAAPRMLEMAKLGTMAFKTVYDYEEYTHKGYDQANNWKVVDITSTKFKGPRVFGVPLGNLLFHPLHESVQDMYIIAERLKVRFDQLKVAEASGKITNVNKLLGQEDDERTELELTRMREEGHQEGTLARESTLDVYEIWFDYDVNGDGIPEKLVATYHKDTRTLLQLRYNWYFHQRKPYTIIPYTVTNDSLYGIGLAEVTLAFQNTITDWHQMATDNAYLSNIRMFIAKTDSKIEEVPRLYTGRVFFVDDPSKDFIPFAVGDIYPSTLLERQNLFGLVEKRTGVSDYMTGRESPIIGSRATATSTLALIEQGTKRVEQVLENIRVGLAEIVELCVYIWIQYGLDDLDDIVFGDDQIGKDLRKFFGSVSAENVDGAIAVDLTATDASGSRQVMQQMQLQIIQTMMMYLEKVLQAGEAAIMAQKNQVPEFAEMVKEVMKAARNMFHDLLTKYDIRNPEEYLPDLEEFINGPTQGSAVPPGPDGGPGGVGAQPGIPGPPGVPRGPAVPVPALPGGGGGPEGSPFTG